MTKPIDHSRKQSSPSSLPPLADAGNLGAGRAKEPPRVDGFDETKLSPSRPAAQMVSTAIRSPKSQQAPRLKKQREAVPTLKNEAFWMSGVRLSSEPPANQGKPDLEVLRPLKCMLATQYRDLPWPAQLKQGLVFTEVSGGLGDISASAKVIAELQRMAPELVIHWAVSDTRGWELQPFLRSAGVNLDKIILNDHPTQATPSDFVIMGPVASAWTGKYVSKRFDLPLKEEAPTFHFGEICADLEYSSTELIKVGRKLLEQGKSSREVHSYLFSGNTDHGNLCSMGLRAGQGLLLSPTAGDGHNAPKPTLDESLHKIESDGLRQNLSDALASSGSQRGTSFNFGYAHKSRNWMRFIDLVAQHETHRNILVALNQAGEFEYLSGADFAKELDKPDARSRRLNQNIGEVRILTEEGTLSLPTANKADARTLTIVLRPRFSPTDMRTLQRCGERLLGTGDNTAIEAWEAGCKLFMYEDVANLGCKNHFLRQQVDLAHSISAPLGRFLELAGMQDALSAEQQQEMDHLLKERSLGDDTMQLCRTVCRDFSFRDNLEGALKRTLWQQLKPELVETEAASVGPTFHQAVKEFVLRGDKQVNIKLSGTDLQAAADRLQRRLIKEVRAEP